MTMQNPVALAANTLQQLGATATQTITSLGNNLNQTASQLLRGLSSGAALPLPLGLPPLPGLAAINGAINGGSTHNNGNPNGNQAGPLGLPGLPTLQQLVPIQAIQAIGQLENTILPPGVPRVSQMLLAAFGPAVAVAEPATPVETGLIPTERLGANVGLEGLNGVQQPTDRDFGIQLV